MVDCSSFFEIFLVMMARARTQRRGSWDEFHALFDQVRLAMTGRELDGKSPDEELMTILRIVAARHDAAAAGASAMVARTRQDDDNDRKPASRDLKRPRMGESNMPILMEWSDEELLNLLVRVPYTRHNEVRAVCRRFNDLVKSDEFRRMRFESKYVEHGIIFAGGTNPYDDGPTTKCSLLAALGLGGNRRSTTRETEYKRVRPIAPLARARRSAASVVFENELFVFGGEVDGRQTLTNEVEAYNPREDEWRSCPPMSETRRDGAIGIVGGRIVVAGGQGGADDHYRDLDSAEAYDPTTETWTSLPPLPHATCRAASCELGGCLYLAGGSDGATVLDHLQMFDGTRWVLKSALPVACVGAYMAAYDGRLVIFGGRRPIIQEDGGTTLVHTRVILTYDPLTDLWASQPVEAGEVFEKAGGRPPQNTVAWERSGKLHLMDAWGGLLVEKETRGGTPTLVGSLNYFSGARVGSQGTETAGGRLLLG